MNISRVSFTQIANNYKKQNASNPLAFEGKKEDKSKNKAAGAMAAIGVMTALTPTANAAMNIQNIDNAPLVAQQEQNVSSEVKPVNGLQKFFGLIFNKAGAKKYEAAANAIIQDLFKEDSAKELSAKQKEEIILKEAQKKEQEAKAKMAEFDALYKEALAAKEEGDNQEAKDEYGKKLLQAQLKKAEALESEGIAKALVKAVETKSYADIIGPSRQKEEAPSYSPISERPTSNVTYSTTNTSPTVTDTPEETPPSEVTEVVLEDGTVQITKIWNSEIGNGSKQEITKTLNGKLIEKTTFSTSKMLETDIKKGETVKYTDEGTIREEFVYKKSLRPGSSLNYSDYFESTRTYINDVLRKTIEIADGVVMEESSYDESGRLIESYVNTHMPTISTLPTIPGPGPTKPPIPTLPTNPEYTDTTTVTTTPMEPTRPLPGQVIPSIKERTLEDGSIERTEVRKYPLPNGLETTKVSRIVNGEVVEETFKEVSHPYGTNAIVENGYTIINTEEGSKKTEYKYSKYEVVNQEGQIGFLEKKSTKTYVDDKLTKEVEETNNEVTKITDYDEEGNPVVTIPGEEAPISTLPTRPTNIETIWIPTAPDQKPTIGPMPSAPTTPGTTTAEATAPTMPTGSPMHIILQNIVPTTPEGVAEEAEGTEETPKATTSVEAEETPKATTLAEEKPTTVSEETNEEPVETKEAEKPAEAEEAEEGEETSGEPVEKREDKE